MNAGLPDTVDAWRMVQAQRSFQGALALDLMPRLRGSLAATQGEVAYRLEFGKDELGVAFLRVRASAALPLTCQRTLQMFLLPVRVDTRLGLIAREADEAALPADYEPLLTADGKLHLADVVEDELILAVPIIPVKPGSESAAFVWSDAAAEKDPQSARTPFSVLEQLKVSRR